MLDKRGRVPVRGDVFVQPTISDLEQHGPPQFDVESRFHILTVALRLRTECARQLNGRRQLVVLTEPKDRSTTERKYIAFT